MRISINLVPASVRHAPFLNLSLLLAYPPTVHLGVLYGQPLPALLLLGALLIIAPLLGGHYRGGMIGAVLAVLLGLLWWLTPLQTLQLFYLPPVAILLMLWWLFASSLLPGREPLVTRIAARLHQRLSPALRRYTRAVTWGWLVVLSLLLVELTWLGCCASPVWWSLFANLLNYLILALVFLVEIGLRPLFLPPEDRIGLRAFVRALSRIHLQGLR